jgi:hypothetical protein
MKIIGDEKSRDTVPLKYATYELARYVRSTVCV